MINVLTALNIAPYAAANDREFGAHAKLRIAAFRALVDSLNWSRADLTGGTREEFKRQDIPGRLGRHIARVEGALPLVPARYASDIESARSAIEYAQRVIERWHAAPAVSR